MLPIYVLILLLVKVLNIKKKKVVQISKLAYELKNKIKPKDVTQKGVRTYLDIEMNFTVGTFIKNIIKLKSKKSVIV